MVEIIEDGNDIALNNNAEKITDELSGMILLDKTAYNLLSAEQKKEYVKYNPSLTSQAYAKYLNAQNEIIEEFNKIGALLNKAPEFKGLEELLAAVKPIEVVSNFVDPLISAINNIKSLPIVGVVADPLDKLLSLIGAVAALLFVMMRNPYMMIKEYQEAFESIDIESVIETLTLETTPNLELQQMKVKSIIIPDKEIKNYVDNNMTKLSVSPDTLNKKIEEIKKLEDLSKKAKELQQAIDTATLTMSVGLAEAVKQTVVTSFENVYEQSAYDYNKDATAFASGVNDFIHYLPQKYIKISDLEKLKAIQETSDKLTGSDIIK